MLIPMRIEKVNEKNTVVLLVALKFYMGAYVVTLLAREIINS